MLAWGKGTEIRSSFYHDALGVGEEEQEIQKETGR